jgi:hypothetical protein
MSVKIELVFGTEDEAIVMLNAVRQAKLALAKQLERAKNPPAPVAVATMPESSPAVGTTEPQAAAEGPTKSPRKARADKGQKREPYKAREQDAAGASASVLIPPNPGSNAGPAVTDPSNAVSVKPATSPSTPVVAPVVAATSGEATNAPAAPAVSLFEPAAPAKASTPAPEKTAPAAAVPKPEAVQAAVAKLFAAKDLLFVEQLLSRFGVAKWRDLLPEQRAEFIARVDAVLAGAAV